MSKVAKAVRGFLKSMNWRWQERTPTRYEVIVPGKAGQWLWLAQWEEDDSVFAGHSIIPVSVPTRRRPAAAEYLNRCDLRLSGREVVTTAVPPPVRRTCAPTSAPRCVTAYARR